MIQNDSRILPKYLKINLFHQLNHEWLNDSKIELSKHQQYLQRYLKFEILSIKSKVNNTKSTQFKNRIELSKDQRYRFFRIKSKD